MKLFEVLLLLAAICAASAGVADIHPLSAQRISLINQQANTWIAGKNFETSDWERVKKLSSGVLGKSPNHKLYTSNPHDESEDVPESFDAREAWPKCDSIKQIRDQSACGSCWAFAAVEAMSDRICIHSKQEKQVYVSAEELTACCSDCGDGCYGGYVPDTFEYWQTSGIVTGGLYNSSQGCQDYSLQPCEHHVKGTRPQCDSLDYTTPICVQTCYDRKLDFKTSKTYGQGVKTFDSEKQMKIEIFKNGPVEAAFTVYDDFPNYKSGVYQKTKNSMYLGGHAIKIIGWGVENGTQYWLCSNSWNEDWGDKGFFKILRGSNHCGIEDNVAASLPKL